MGKRQRGGTAAAAAKKQASSQVSQFGINYFFGKHASQTQAKLAATQAQRGVHGETDSARLASPDPPSVDVLQARNLLDPIPGSTVVVGRPEGRQRERELLRPPDCTDGGRRVVGTEGKPLKETTDVQSDGELKGPRVKVCLERTNGAVGGGSAVPAMQGPVNNMPTTPAGLLEVPCKDVGDARPSTPCLAGPLSRLTSNSSVMGMPCLDEDGGGDEVEWKISPAAEKLHSVAPLHSSDNSDPPHTSRSASAMHSMLATASVLHKFPSKKAEGEQTTNLLEEWLASSVGLGLQQAEEENLRPQLRGEEEKENMEPSTSCTPFSREQGLRSLSSRRRSSAFAPSTARNRSNASSGGSGSAKASARRRSLAANGRTGAEKPASRGGFGRQSSRIGRRKALLDLLDRVETAINKRDKQPRDESSPLSFSKAPEFRSPGEIRSPADSERGTTTAPSSVGTARKSPGTRTVEQGVLPPSWPPEFADLLSGDIDEILGLKDDDPLFRCGGFGAAHAVPDRQMAAMDGVRAIPGVPAQPGPGSMAGDFGAVCGNAALDSGGELSSSVRGELLEGVLTDASNKDSIGSGVQRQRVRLMESMEGDCGRENARQGSEAGPQEPVLHDTEVLAFRTDRNEGLAGVAWKREVDLLEDLSVEEFQGVERVSQEGKEMERNQIHFKVLQVHEQDYEGNTPGSLYPEKVLKVQNETTGEEKTVFLREEWVYTVVKAGDHVNVVGKFDSGGCCSVDHKQNLLVVHPDLMISGSRVASSYNCPRRAVLDERIRQLETSVPALTGTMLHELFQVAITMNTRERTSERLRAEAQIIVQQHLEGLYAVGEDDRTAQKNLEEGIPKILDWCSRFVGQAVPSANRVEFGFDKKERDVVIPEVVDIEETIWSPRYGVKGMLDASVSVRSRTGSGNPAVEEVMPLELKTGKMTTGSAAVEHRGQVILYTLLMAERYGREVGSGLLYYMHTGQTQGVQSNRADVTGLLMRRNDLAANLTAAAASQELPEMLKSLHQCRKCFQLNACTTYHRALEGGTAETSGLGSLFEEKTQHITPEHSSFLRKWDRLIDLEANETMKARSEIWSVPSTARERLGRCLANMILDPPRPLHPPVKSPFLYRFVRTERGGTPPPPLGSSFGQGDHVVLSTEDGQAGVCTATVVEAAQSSITLALPKRLQRQMIRSTGSWRIDKDEIASSFTLMRLNLLRLFVAPGGAGEGGEDASGLQRPLIVDLEAPRFRTLSAGHAGLEYLSGLANCNPDQQHAVRQVLEAEEYCLILGMPGTGKTTTIVHAVKALLASGSSVLVTAYTNSAVDNLLIKLQEADVDFIRVGRPESVHERVRSHVLSIDSATAPTSVAALQSRIHCARVVGVTALGVTHALFQRRLFDVCIVDEAGQITMPACLGPLRCARQFVLVGDHNQLPPLVKCPAAREGGMAESLFSRLSEAHPNAVAALTWQYRMCEDVMALSNALVYNGRLQCGSAEVAEAKLEVPGRGVGNAPGWLARLFDPRQSVVFLNTDGMPALESRVGEAIKNEGEARILSQAAHALVERGVEAQRIGAMSPYSAQVKLLQQLLKDIPGLEVLTIDRFQGRDKDCTLVSFVRSNGKEGNPGQLLSDWRRINVALTRAKKKLVMVGSRTTLSCVPLFRQLFTLVEEKGWLVDVWAGGDSGPRPWPLQKCKSEPPVMSSARACLG